MAKSLYEALKGLETKLKEIAQEADHLDDELRWANNLLDDVARFIRLGKPDDALEKIEEVQGQIGKVMEALWKAS